MRYITSPSTTRATLAPEWIVVSQPNVEIDLPPEQRQAVDTIIEIEVA